VLDAQRQTPRGSLISYIDLSQGKRAIVGLTSGVHTTSDAADVPNLLPKSSGENRADHDSAVSAPLNGVSAATAERWKTKTRKTVVKNR